VPSNLWGVESEIRPEVAKIERQNTPISKPLSMMAHSIDLMPTVDSERSDSNEEEWSTQRRGEERTGLLVDTENTCSFARSRADST